MSANDIIHVSIIYTCSIAVPFTRGYTSAAQIEKCDIQSALIDKNKRDSEMYNKTIYGYIL